MKYCKTHKISIILQTAYHKVWKYKTTRTSSSFHFRTIHLKIPFLVGTSMVDDKTVSVSLIICVEIPNSQTPTGLMFFGVSPEGYLVSPVQENIYAHAHAIYRGRERKFWQWFCNYKTKEKSKRMRRTYLLFWVWSERWTRKKAKKRPKFHSKPCKYPSKDLTGILDFCWRKIT